MQITLNQYFVRNLEFQQITSPEGGDNSLDFDYSVLFSKEQSREFVLEFGIDVKNKDEFTCNFNYVFFFKTSDDITDEFIKSHFPRINAPAIAFPFIRAFLSTLTLNAGYLPAILPSINFTRIDDAKGRVYLDGELIPNPPKSIPGPQK